MDTKINGIDLKLTIVRASTYLAMLEEEFGTIEEVAEEYDMTHGAVEVIGVTSYILAVQSLIEKG